MIAVIADDFTGAAEIGGIGLRYGLKVVIETEPMQNHQADLLIIATDTRSLPPKKAAAYTARVTQHLIQYQPSFIFKKVDSVLRGNITIELLAQMKASGKKRAIIVAANPIFKRIINNGIYYIDNVPLHQTHFSSDPEFPITSASVLEIVKPEKQYPLFNLKPEETLPEKGLIIGDVVALHDLEQWALKVDDHTVLAGASGFFNAILSQRSALAKKLIKKPLTPVKFGKKVLFVLGSTFSRDHDFLKKLSGNGHHLSNMPQEMYYNSQFSPHHLDQWVDDIVKAFHKKQTVIVSIVHARSNEPNIESRIRENIGVLISRVVEKVALHELLIEGGSTTSAVLRHLNIKKLWPVQELETGVIRMKMEGHTHLHLTTKPGSYVWPEDLWSLQETRQLKMKKIAYD